MLDPKPGYWLIRLVKGGPLVPACIRIVETTFEPDEPSNDMRGTRSSFPAAFVNDEPVDIDRVWLTRGAPITADEYAFRCADAAWAVKHAPNEPAARPTQRVDLRQLPIPF